MLKGSGPLNKAAAYGKFDEIGQFKEFVSQVRDKNENPGVLLHKL